MHVYLEMTEILTTLEICTVKLMTEHQYAQTALHCIVSSSHNRELEGYIALNNCSSLFKFAYINYIEDITRWREDMNFIFEWQNNILWMSAASE